MPRIDRKQICRIKGNTTKESLINYLRCLVLAASPTLIRGSQRQIQQIPGEENKRWSNWRATAAGLSAYADFLPARFWGASSGASNW